MTTVELLDLSEPVDRRPWSATAAALARTARTSRVVDLLANVAVLVGLWLAYAAVRGVTAGDWATATANAERLLAVQDAVALPSEAWVQRHILSATELVRAANRFYLYVHFPGTALFLALTWTRRRALFGRVRDALVLVTGAALVLHVLFPLAPPRMMPGFVDTGAVVGPSPYDLAAAESANQIAAMPSLHVGWALLVAIAAVAGLRTRWRWILAAHPVVTTAVVVVTANHYWADAIVAAVLVVAGWAVVGRWSDRRPPATGGGVVDLTNGEAPAGVPAPGCGARRHVRRPVCRVAGADGRRRVPGPVRRAPAGPAPAPRPVALPPTPGGVTAAGPAGKASRPATP